MSEKEAKQIQYLARTIAKMQGELLGTQVAVRALILAHADPLGARQAVGEQIEKVIAIGLPKAIDEAFLDCLTRAKQRVLPSKRDLDELRRE